MTATAFAAGLLLAMPAFAQTQQPPRIVVTGAGEFAVAPDMATVTLSILRQAATAREALDAANAATARVIEALKAEGIADRDLRTSGLSVQPDYVYPQPTDRDQGPRITGYRVTNSVTARLRDLARVGAVVDAAVTLGVNQGGDIVFGNADTKPAMEAARRQAVADARARAQTLAEAAGARLGGLLEITEGSGVQPPRPYDGRLMRMEAASDGVPIEAGENVYRVEVQVTWAIAE